MGIWLVLWVLAMVEGASIEDDGDKLNSHKPRQLPEDYENAYTNFAKCISENKLLDGVISQIKKDAGIETKYWCAGIPLLEQVEGVVRACPQAVALAQYADSKEGGSENAILTSLSVWQSSVWEKDVCTQKFVAEMETIDNRRRRLKKYSAEDSAGVDATWGLHISVGLSTAVFSFSSTIGFVSNNCGCEKWDDGKLYATKTKAKEKLSNEAKNRDVDFFCMKASDPDRHCYLPDANGMCPPETAPCKNNGLTWSWSVGTGIALDTDLFLTLGLSAISAGISVSLGFDFHIPHKQCAYFPGTSFGVSSSFSLPAKIGSFSPALSMRMGCPTAEVCPITSYGYCGTSIGVSVSTSAGVKSILDAIENQVGSYNAAVSISLPLGSGGPLVGVGRQMIAPGGGCDNVAYGLGWDIMTSIGDKPAYPLGEWKCTKKTFSDMQGQIPEPYRKAPTYWFHKTADYAPKGGGATKLAMGFAQSVWEDQNSRWLFVGIFAVTCYAIVARLSPSPKEEAGIYHSLL